ncbi:hypothetical protein [Leucobacter sp. gxy201]|uniref:hypothetical protein n=1 Tax=Leucobacter sp. gxy201 TaxID=2957200 RepID=UPI003D9FFA2E
MTEDQQPSQGLQPPQLVPGQAPPPYPTWAPRPSGRKFWALGFLAFIPWAGWIVAPIVLLVQQANVRRDPSPVVRENARWAANWMLTATLAMIIGLGGLLAAAVFGQIAIDAGGSFELMPLVVMSAVLMVLMQLAHAVISLIGTILAADRVFDPVAVIRFIPPVDG